MPRPRKNAAAEKAEPKETKAVEKTVDDGLTALKHFAKSGRLFIEGEAYEIVDSVVKVKPEHVIAAKEHIKLGG